MKITIRCRKRDENTNFVYLDIRDGKNSRRQSVKGFVYTGKKLNKEQKEHNAKVMTLAESQKADVLTVGCAIGAKSPTIARLTELYTESKDSAENTVKSFKQMLSCIDGTVTTDTITTNVINDLYKQINACELSNNSKLLYRSKLDAVIRYGIKRGFVKSGVLDKVDDKIKGKTTSREYLTKDEMMLMLKDYADNGKNWMRVFLFSCFTGLRYSDVKTLDWSNIKDDVIRLQTRKTDTSVVIPLNDSAKSLLPAGAESGKVFDVPDVANIRKDLRLWANKKGIKKEISFHTARHTFATLAIMGNVDIYAVSKLLGHHSIKTTQIYADMVTSKLKESVDKLNDVFK